MSAFDRAVRAFADEIGTVDPVTVRAGGCHWDIGGTPPPGTREVRPPSGIAEHNPAEMTVRAGAGTTLAELHHELGSKGQVTVLDGPPNATIGGILMVGRSGVRRLRQGPVRDALLQARYVSADGEVITCGGPTVKNVTGYDLCRLFVGSLGILGCVAEVILRTAPRPRASEWWRTPADPFALFEKLYRPSSLLWDGTWCWVLLEGYAADVADLGEVVRAQGGQQVEGPPPLPPVRLSVAPGDLEALVRSGAAGDCVAEIGVGLIHGSRPIAHASTISPRVVALHQRLKREFDPTGRLNPGRDPLAIGAAA